MGPVEVTLLYSQNYFEMFQAMEIYVAGVLEKIDYCAEQYALIFNENR